MAHCTTTNRQFDQANIGSFDYVATHHKHENFIYRPIAIAEFIVPSLCTHTAEAKHSKAPQHIPVRRL